MDSSYPVQRVNPLKYLAFLFVILIGYAFIYTLLFGDLGFNHDEWRFLEIAYNKSIHEGIQEGIYEFSRPLMGVFGILTYRVIGFQDVTFNLISGFERVLSVFLMSVALAWAWPGKMRWVILISLGVFFLPPFTSTTYTFAIDCAWQALICFWLCVLCWQFGVHFSGAARLAFILGGVLLGTSFLVYESALALFPIGGILMGCVLIARHPNPRLKTWLLPGILWIGSVLIGYFIYAVVRERYGIGLHSSFRGLPSLDIWISYPLTFLKFFSLPPTIEQASLLDFVIAGVVGISAWGLMGYTQDTDSPPQISTHGLALLFGFMAFGLGVAPYLLTGYVPVWKYSPIARIYNSGAFGIVSVLCWFLPRRGRFWPLVRFVAAVWIGIMALFPLTSRYDLQYVARLREQFMTDLVVQVPRVREGTTLVLINVYEEIGQAQTIAGNMRFSRIFYDPSVEAINVMSSDYTKAFSTRINSQGINVEATTYRPLDTIILLQRQGNHLILVDCLPAEALPTISWGNGVSEICTNKDRILPDPEGETLTNLRQLNLLPEVPPFGDVVQTEPEA